MKDHYINLANIVRVHLELEHGWTNIQVHENDVPRALLRGLSRKRLYIHPDDQINMIMTQKGVPSPANLEPELEWVLPMHVSEKFTIEILASVFDQLPNNFSNPERPKRIVLAVVHPDSTVVYYIMHDGLVKPRQN